MWPDVSIVTRLSHAKQTNLYPPRPKRPTLPQIRFLRNRSWFAGGCRTVTLHAVNQCAAPTSPSRGSAAIFCEKLNLREGEGDSTRSGNCQQRTVEERRDGNLPARGGQRITFQLSAVRRPNPQWSESTLRTACQPLWPTWEDPSVEDAIRPEG